MSSAPGPPISVAELSLHGLFQPSPGATLETLLDRLCAFCGDLTKGSAALGDETLGADLFEHEIVFVPAVETPPGPQRNDDLLLRLRSTFLERGGRKRRPGKNVVTESAGIIPLEERHWTLLQFSNPDITYEAATCRPVVLCDFEAGDPITYLKALGYKFSGEFVRRGYDFYLRILDMESGLDSYGGAGAARYLRITVARIERVPAFMNPSSLQPFHPFHPPALPVNSLISPVEAPLNPSAPNAADVWLVQVSSMPDRADAAKVEVEMGRVREAVKG
ncbi:hypothetical protein HDU93_002997 [Gonapodya sp. JEL0774]|nr:hypothetical protein HDU93_002997 [Gonapodya sp. JEL0774]